MPLKDKEREKQYQKEYRIKNKEKIAEYFKTENGKKSIRINNWKTQNIIFHDYDFLYDIFINTTNCDDCKRCLTQDNKTKSTTKCLDHDHSITDNENVRGVVCHTCNCKRR